EAQEGAPRGHPLVGGSHRHLPVSLPSAAMLAECALDGMGYEIGGALMRKNEPALTAWSTRGIGTERKVRDRQCAMEISNTRSPSSSGGGRLRALAPFGAHIKMHGSSSVGQQVAYCVSAAYAVCHSGD